MSFQEYESDSYCVSGRHHSATTINYGDFTSKRSKVLIGKCSISNRKKLMTVSDDTKQAERLGNFIKSLGKSSVEVGKKFLKTYYRTHHVLSMSQQTRLPQ